MSVTLLTVGGNKIETSKFWHDFTILMMPLKNPDTIAQNYFVTI
jgi:hypothetical protein